MASLPTILILGPDTVAAALPATPVQLIHACRAWGFEAVVPSSWGDELIATAVVQRCATAGARPVVQCSCPRVSDRLARHGMFLGDSVLWLVAPPVAVAKYLRALNDGDLHVTYAGECPGALDSSIDERITPRDLLAAILGRGIDLAKQPVVFDDLIPADRRRHASSAGGLPDQHHLWDATQFRVARPRVDGQLVVDAAQLLLTDERLLIDLGPSSGCVCHVTDELAAVDTVTLQRSPTPIVVNGRVDLTRPAPVATVVETVSAADAVVELSEARPVESSPSLPRPTLIRPSVRRPSGWRRQSPRPGMVIARPSAVTRVTSDRVPLLRTRAARWALAALLLGATLMVGIWFGRRSTTQATGSSGATGLTDQRLLAPLGRPRSP